VKLTDAISLTRPSHLVANALAYTLGMVIALRFYGFNQDFFIGLISLLLVYSGVYIFNDVTDLEEDKMHEVNWKKQRPLPSNKVNPGFAKKELVVLIIAGLLLSTLVNWLFMIVLLLIVVINFFYTGLRLKRWPMFSMNLLVALQVMKIVLGWLSINTNTLMMPLTFFITYGLGYGLSISVYKKKRFSSEKRFRLYAIITGLSALVMFVASIIIHDWIRLPLLMVALISTVFGLILFKLKDKLSKEFTKGLWVAAMMVLMIIIAFVIDLILF
jgi:hypothetical protein